MSYIRNRKHASVRQPLLTQSLIALAALGPLAAQAQQASGKDEQQLKGVTVTATADSAYKAEAVSSPKLTQPLLDTTQTITVIKKEVLAQQGAGSLVEALRNTPGITLQLGENGNTSAGDTFQMRGFSAQTSIFLDGIRDLGAVSRDVFNIEQIEVSRGPAGTDVGRGAAAGYINLASKLPGMSNAASAIVSYDSGERLRATADLNQKIGASSAFRINVLAQDGGQVGRKVIDKKTIGVAPSLAFGLGTPTRVFLFSQHTRQDGLPDGGLPAVGLGNFYNANPAVDNAPQVDRDNFYGFDSDYEEVNADMVTVKIEHQLGADSMLTNTSRYGKSNIDRILTGINALGNLGTVDAPSAPNTWTVARSRQSVLQENKIMANTTNVVTEFQTGSVGHTVSTGLEFLSEEQTTPLRTVASLGVAAPANLYHPNRNDALAAYAPALGGAYSKGNTTTAAVYAFDTLKLNDQWQVNGGVRVERYNTATSSIALSTATANPTLPVNTPLGSRFDKSDNLVSWKVGALYKPKPDGSIYLAYATSETPPGSANFALSANANNINNAAMDPQKTRNLELGTKWDLIQKKLAVTATLYRTENRNEIPVLEDQASNTYSQGGNRRVQGLELGVVGQITPAWSVIGGFATMDAELIEGAGNTPTGTGTRWSPDRSANLWTTYKINDKFTVGGGARYMSEQRRVIAPGLPQTAGAQAVPSYAVTDAVLSYKISKNVSLQLNVYNVFDREYVAALNNGGSRILAGAPRSAQLTANIGF